MGLAFAHLLLAALVATPQDQEPKPLLELGIELRLSDLKGELDGDIDWDGLFENGVGLRLHGAYLWPIGDSLRLGPYLSFGFDGWSGDEETVSGVTFEPDPLLSVRLMTGLAFRQELSRVLFLEERLGVGLVHWSSSDVDVSAGGPPVTMDGVETSDKFAFEAELRGGVRLWKIVLLGMGFSYGKLGAPDVSSETFPALDPEDPWIFSFSLFLIFSW